MVENSGSMDKRMVLKYTCEQCKFEIEQEEDKWSRFIDCPKCGGRAYDELYDSNDTSRLLEGICR